MLSQAMLGDADAAKRYLALLLDDRMESDVNAGFHLEYYGDQPLDDALPLCSRDLGEQCERTLTYLESSLSRSLDAGWNSLSRPLAPIELYTFTSILARRLHSSRHSVVVKMARILERALEYLEDDDLKLYVHLCVDLSYAQPQEAARRVGQYFSARNAPRNGWVKRGVQFPESVGSHTAGVMWLVNLIPEVEAVRLRIGRIKDMLECHDLAEGLTGDIVTDKRDPEQDERERRLIRTLSWLGTYLRPEVDLYSTYASYLEFHQRVTPEAQVARDLDAIDIVLQGQSLLQSRADCDREAVRSLVAKLERLITTQAGRHVLSTARQMNVISASSFAPTPDSAIKDYFFGRATVAVPAG
jgi:5'-deoxynucleotidase YfbR-like HD superfamily hydrolase